VPYTRADARADLRKQLNDRIEVTDPVARPPSHLHRLENSTPVNGIISEANDRFLVKHYPVLSKIVVGVETLIQVQNQLGTLFVVDTVGTDYTKGIIQLTTGPEAPTEVIYITYFSKWYLDEELDQALTEAQTFIGVSPVSDDVTALPVVDGLRPALLMYAKAIVFEANSTKTADNFNFSAGGKTENKADSAKQWEDKAEKSKKQAETLRDDFYTRKGQREAPAMAVGAPAGTSGYQVQR